MTSENQKIDREASEWAVRVQTRALTAEEQQDHDRWLAASERHRGAFLRARAAWVDLDRLAALRGSKEFERAPAVREAHKRTVLLGIAASLVICALGSVLWWSWPEGKRYTTVVGGLDNVRLEDGSVVTMNTDTSIRVVLADAERRVELERGEALFEVAKDASRPFIVQAGEVSVRAVGTAFLVRTIDNRTDVTVTEGVVELSDAGGPGGPFVRRLAAHEHATVLQKRQVDVRSITPDDAQRELAWRDRMIDFAGRSLSEAVEEINRHNASRIVVDDPVLGARPVVGVFRADDPRGFAETVAAALGAQVVVQPDAIHLRPLP